MAGEYDFVELGEVASVRSGFAFKSSDWTSSGVPVVKIANVKDGRLALGGCSFVSQSVAESADEFALRSGDILIAMTGYIGDVAAVREHNLPAMLNQRVGRFSIRDLRLLEPRFLFYLLRDSDIRRAIEGLGYGSAQPNVSPSLIHGVEIPLPPLSDQRAIAHILGTMDDKIELNRRMNETLEAMARALFKSWFVDFDPVRAKAEGRDPGLPRSVADLFPARLVESELGEIPEGWQVWRVAQVGDVICGKTPSTRVPEYYGHDVPFVTIPDMHGKIFVTATRKHLSQAGAASQPQKMLPAGAICVSCIATPGLVVITTEESQTNQQINTVVPGESDEIYFWFWSLHNLGDEIQAGGSGGSVLTNLSTGRFADLSVLAPPSKVRSSYHSFTAHLFCRILANEKEARTLAGLRDSLLPKLVSGELQVKDAERFISRSVA